MPPHQVAQPKKLPSYSSKIWGSIYWGSLRHIISHRDSHFTENFWRELFDILDMELHLSTSFHLQTDRQIEQVSVDHNLNLK